MQANLALAYRLTCRADRMERRVRYEQSPVLAEAALLRKIAAALLDTCRGYTLRGEGT